MKITKVLLLRIPEYFNINVEVFLRFLQQELLTGHPLDWTFVTYGLQLKASACYRNKKDSVAFSISGRAFFRYFPCIKMVMSHHRHEIKKKKFYRRAKK